MAILGRLPLGLIAVLFLLASCGGGIGGTGSGGKVAATGTGTVTGFGSVIVNDTRTFQIDGDTRISLDDTPISEAQLRTAGEGLVVKIDVGTDVNADFTSGTAVVIDAENWVKGPVTATNPLRVLGQDVVVTGDTVLRGGLVIADLVAGDILEVSGYASAANIIQATRIERKAAIPTWKLTGPVSNVTATTFDIGMQTIAFGGVVPRDCGAGLNNGELVEVEATPDAGVVSGSTLSTVTDIQCIQPGLGVPDNPAGSTLKAEIEGLVTSVPPDFGVSRQDFVLNGQQVLTTVFTVFEGGALEDIIAGAKVEAEGILDTVSGILTADKIRFRESRVRIEAPVAPIDIMIGQSLAIMGITVTVTSLTEDEDAIVSSGIAVDTQIEVRGFADNNGEVSATRIRDRGAPDFDDVRLRGSVSSIPTPPVFQILGVSVDTTGTTLIDVNGFTVSETEFFNQLAVGSEVDVENGSYDGIENTISSGPNSTIIEIED